MNSRITSHSKSTSLAVRAALGRPRDDVDDAEEETETESDIDVDTDSEAETESDVSSDAESDWSCESCSSIASFSTLESPWSS